MQTAVCLYPAAPLAGTAATTPTSGTIAAASLRRSVRLLLATLPPSLELRRSAVRRQGLGRLGGGRCCMTTHVPPRPQREAARGEPGSLQWQREAGGTRTPSIYSYSLWRPHPACPASCDQTICSLRGASSRAQTQGLATCVLACPQIWDAATTVTTATNTDLPVGPLPVLPSATAAAVKAEPHDQDRWGCQPSRQGPRDAPRAVPMHACAGLPRWQVDACEVAAGPRQPALLVLPGRALVQRQWHARAPCLAWPACQALPSQLGPACCAGHRYVAGGAEASVWVRCHRGLEALRSSRGSRHALRCAVRAGMPRS